jgi:MoaA/NifB/PqqE/SkfB family radical SAM enzyme
MNYHIILTERCNSQCKYYYEKSLNEFENKTSEVFDFDFFQPVRSGIDIKKLKAFLSKDKNPVLIFYGGEPLLEVEKIKK